MSVNVHVFKPTAEAEPLEGSGYYYYDRGTPPEAKLVIANTELVVPTADKRLDIEIASDAEVYGAGDEATLTFQVNNGAGQPEEARIMVAVVDEAIFSLSEDLTADIFDTFYHKRNSSVSTYQSAIDPYIRDYYWLDLYPTSEEAHSDLPTVGAPTSEPDDTSSEESVATEAIETRRIFEDTAYWNPAVTTDANGIATVKVPLPDNLTEWRIIARAVTLDTKVGEQMDSILVTQRGDCPSHSASICSGGRSIYCRGCWSKLHGPRCHRPSNHAGQRSDLAR